MDAETAAKAKENFDLLNNFAHDLKLPLSAAKSYIELAEFGASDDKTKAFLHKANNNLEKALNIIAELLDYSRMEATYTLRYTDCDLSALVHETLQALEVAIKQKQLQVTVDESVQGVVLSVDTNMMRHVINNLIGNAVKYNREGGSVQIRAKQSSGRIHIEVEDTGIGIPAEALERVFERFYRAETREVKRIDGTGLGLAIVETAIQRHGGEVSVVSEVGKGSIFSFWLPQASSSVDATAMLDDSLPVPQNVLEPKASRNSTLSGEAIDGLDDWIQEAPDSAQGESDSEDV